MISNERMFDDILQINALLKCEECEDLIRKAEVAGFARARFEKRGRRNDETFIKDVLLAGTLKSRLSDHCLIDEVDDIFEVYRYSANDEIRAHLDCGREIKNGLQSNATLLIYLSDDFCGGRTIFSESELSIRPATGRAIVFRYHLTHRGEKVSSGTKYIARVDISVKRMH